MRTDEKSTHRMEFGKTESGKIKGGETIARSGGGMTNDGVHCEVV